MTDNRDLIARRIRALQAKTVENGCTEEEALIAAQKAGELMAQYRLTQSDLEIQAEPVEHREVDRRQREKQVSEDSCLRGIQRYCGVKAWLSLGWDEKGEKRRRLVLFGLRADCDLAEWLYKMIGSTIMAEAERFKARTSGAHTVAARRQMVLAFRMGMAARINERLVAMAAALEPAARTGSGTALTVVRNAVVEAAYAQLGIKLRKSKARRVRNAAAFWSGHAAGGKVSLNRPIGATVAGVLR